MHYNSADVYFSMHKYFLRNNGRLGTLPELSGHFSSRSAGSGDLILAREEIISAGAFLRAGDL